MKDFSEVGNVMHNKVGCLIGWLMVKGLWLMVKGYPIINVQDDAENAYFDIKITFDKNYYYLCKAF